MKDTCGVVSSTKALRISSIKGGNFTFSIKYDDESIVVLSKQNNIHR